MRQQDLEQASPVGAGVVNMSGWDTLKHEIARWLDRMVACRVLSHPVSQPANYFQS